MRSLAREQRRITEGSTAVVKVQYLDGESRPLARAAVEAVALTLQDRRTATIINGRDSQSVLDENNGAVSPDLSITAATQTNPVKLTFSTSHQLDNGLQIYIESVLGMTELNGRTVAVTKVSDTEVYLDDVDGSEFTAYISGGTGRVGLLIMTLQPADNPIVGLSITGATQANPVALTFSSAHELNEGEVIYVEGVEGMTELNNREFRVKKVAYNSVELLGENGESYAAYTTGGKAVPRIGNFETHIARFDLQHTNGDLPHAVLLDVQQLL